MLVYHTVVVGVVICCQDFAAIGKKTCAVWKGFFNEELG